MKDSVDEDRHKRWFSLGQLDLFNLLALMVGLVALFFSWRANQISLQQYRSNLTVLDVQTIGYDFDLEQAAPTALLACVERMRIANLGNAPDSIVGFDTVVYYNNIQSIFRGSGIAPEAFAMYSLADVSTLEPESSVAPSLVQVADRLSVKVGPALGFPVSSLSSDMDLIELPYEIEGYKTQDLELSLIFGAALGTDYNVHFDSGEAMFPSAPTDLPPLEWEIHFRLASGAVTASPRIKCGAIRRADAIVTPEPVQACRSDPEPMTGGNGLYGITARPSPPAYLKLEDRVLIDFRYTTNEDQGILVWAFPHFTQNNWPSDFGTNSSRVYPVGNGAGQAFVTVSKGKAKIDQIRLVMQSPDHTRTLFECAISGQYIYQ